MPLHAETFGVHDLVSYVETIRGFQSMPGSLNDAFGQIRVINNVVGVLLKSRRRVVRIFDKNLDGTVRLETEL
ncbi:hypothetical protein AB1L42_14970 [Thalassoglobus sp. JC818]|uniref:hypothetical protein n=1 Tax=Thalassoglobus sp. JC818 TaxID=3232136 RepID=UPI0034593B0F